MSKYELTDEDRANLDGRPLVASLSGGKDSTAMSLQLMEWGLKFDAVFMDTGWEHPLSVKYVTEELPSVLGIEIKTLRPKLSMIDRILRYGHFPSRRTRWCTRELKVSPYEAHISATYKDTPPVSAVGIRAGESKARSTQPRWDVEAGDNMALRMWRPLIDWSVDDVIEIHQRHNVRPNPLYLKYGVERVGCWPCIFARKKEIATIAKADPERIDLIHKLEQTAKSILELRGLDRNYAEANWPPSMFALRTTRAGETDIRSASIYEVIEWAQTARGGKQFELDLPEEPGCVRWGMCDTGADE